MLPASQNSLPTKDQNLRFSLPHLKPEQKFDPVFTYDLNLKSVPCFRYAV